METKKPVGYRLIKCKERSFEMKLVSGEKYSAKSVAFHFGCRIEPIGKNQLSFVINIIYTIDGQEAFKQETETVFELEPMEQAIECQPDGRIVDHVNIVPTLLGLSYSSTRGMIAIRTAGTGLEYYPAPIVDAAEIAKKMSELK